MSSKRTKESSSDVQWILLDVTTVTPSPSTEGNQLLRSGRGVLAWLMNTQSNKDSDDSTHSDSIATIRDILVFSERRVFTNALDKF